MRRVNGVVPFILVFVAAIQPFIFSCSAAYLKSANNTRTLEFLKDIEDVANIANAGVMKEEEKLEERANFTEKVAELKEEVADRIRDEAKEEKVDSASLDAVAESSMPTKDFFLGAPNGVGSWKRPVDYMIDGAPKNIAWQKLSDRTKLGAISYPTPVEGVLVTIYNPRPDRLWTVWDYGRIAQAINEVGVDSRVPLDKSTRCFCKLVAQPTMKNHPRCVCTHPSIKQHEKVKTPLPKKTLKKEIKAASEEDLKAHIARSKQRASEARVKKAASAERGLNLLQHRLKQHREDVYEHRQNRLQNELSSLNSHGSKFILQDIDESRKFYQSTKTGIAHPPPKALLVRDIQGAEAETRTLLAALSMQRSEVLARIREYARLNSMAEVDLRAAGDSAQFLAHIVHKKAKALAKKFMRETPVNISKALPEVLGSIDEETRPVVMAWLAQKQKESWEEQVNKTRGRLDHLERMLNAKEEEFERNKATEQFSQVSVQLEQNGYKEGTAGIESHLYIVSGLNQASRIDGRILQGDNAINNSVSASRLQQQRRQLLVKRGGGCLC